MYNMNKKSLRNSIKKRHVQHTIVMVASVAMAVLAVGIFAAGTVEIIQYNAVIDVEVGTYTRGDLAFEPNTLLVWNERPGMVCNVTIMAGNVTASKILNGSIGKGLIIFTYGVHSWTYKVVLLNGTEIERAKSWWQNMIVHEYVAIREHGIDHESDSADFYDAPIFMASLTCILVASCILAGYWLASWCLDWYRRSRIFKALREALKSEKGVGS